MSGELSRNRPTLTTGCAIVATIPMVPQSSGERFPFTRKSPRYRFRASAELIEPIGKQHVSGRTSVISETGCQIRAIESLNLGTTVQLSIEREGISFKTSALVTSVMPESMGLVFLNTEKSQMEILRQWIAEAAGRV